MVRKNSEEQLTEPVLVDTSKNSKYDTDEVYQIVVEKKNQGMNFSEIAEALKLRGYDKITSTKVSEVYTKAIARAVRTHNVAQEKFTDFSVQLDEMNVKRLQILNGLLDNVIAFAELAEGDKEMTSMQKKTLRFKYYPQIISTLSEFNRVMDSYLASQDKVIKAIEAEKTTPLDVMQLINKQLESTICSKCGSKWSQ